MDAPPKSATKPATKTPPDARRIDRYVITGELGRGAMGMVYRADDPLLERQVALKVLSISMGDREGEDFRERFFREAKAAGRLNHPNIVTIYDVGEAEDSTPFIAMEYLQGRTLRDSLDTGVVPTVRRVADIGTLVSRGLAFAHEHGVVHRDIKPGNIMLTRNGMVKIMDFGIARSGQGGHTMIDTVLGSPKYMAPEQIAGSAVDARADIFSLAVTLYEMLTGRAPFEGDSIPAIMHQVLNVLPPPPSTLNPDVPQVFDDLLRRAMAKHPDERIGTARELGESLRRISKALRGHNAVPEDPMTQPAETEAPMTEMGDATIMVAPMSPMDATLFNPIGAATQASSRPAPAQTAAPATPAKGSQPHKATINAPLLLALGGVVLLIVAIMAYITGTPETTQAADTPAPAVTKMQPVPKETAPVVEAPAPVVSEPAPVAAVPAMPTIQPLPEPPPLPVTHAATTSSEVITPFPAEQKAAEEDKTPSADKKLAAAKAPVAKPKAAPGNVQVTAVPWGEIYVDGKRRGISPPLHTLELAPGRYQVEIRNSDLPAHVRTVEVQSGETIRIRHQFQ